MNQHTRTNKLTLLSSDQIAALKEWLLEKDTGMGVQDQDLFGERLSNEPQYVTSELREALDAFAKLGAGSRYSAANEKHASNILKAISDALGHPDPTKITESQCDAANGFVLIVENKFKDISDGACEAIKAKLNALERANAPALETIMESQMPRDETSGRPDTGIVSRRGVAASPRKERAYTPVMLPEVGPMTEDDLGFLEHFCFKYMSDIAPEASDEDRISHEADVEALKAAFGEFEGVKNFEKLRIPEKRLGYILDILHDAIKHHVNTSAEPLPHFDSIHRLVSHARQQGENIGLTARVAIESTLRSEFEAGSNWANRVTQPRDPFEENSLSL